MDQNQRTRFYEGQFLGADDLRALERHPRVQAAQHALGAHTWGIAVGLDLIEKTQPSGEIENILTPGYAWDGFGRPIVVLAPVKIPAQALVNFQGPTPAAGWLVKVWIRYDEQGAQNPAPGFEVCGVDDQHARIVETYAIEVGEPMTDPHDPVLVAGSPVAAESALKTFGAKEPTLFDASVPFQTFPDTPKSRWLVPIGFVRWQKLAAQPGRFVARVDTGTPKDSDAIRSVRQYAGVVAESINAAAGVLRLRDRAADPDPSKTFFHPPMLVSDPQNPNDLVWVEGSLRVVGHTRVAGGQIEWRTESGSDGDTPLWLRRRGDAGKPPAQTGGRALEAVIGKPGQDDSRFAVGPIKADQSVDERLTVLSSGNVGISAPAPKARVQIKTQTAIDEGGTWANFGSNATYNGTWTRVTPTKAGVNLHMSPEGNGSEFRFLRVEANGSNLRNIAALGTAVSFIREGRFGVGNDAPAAQIHVKALTAIDEGSAADGLWANIGQNAFYDGSWEQLDKARAGVNLHMNPDGGGKEFRFMRIEKTGVNARNVAVIGSQTSFIAESNLGIGTTTPAARLDVHGRILRHSQDFTQTGIASHDQVIAVPWGTTDDWNMLVSAREMGQEEPNSEFDNAVLMMQCWATPEPSKTGFKVTARYKFRWSQGGDTGNGAWLGGTATYLLVPR